MKEILMVDLQGQYKQIQEDVNLALLSVINRSSFIQGPEVKIFEVELAKYVGAAHCISCASGTDALQLAFMALNLKPGDEIIVPSFTYIATAEAAALLGLVPVFVDSDPNNFNIALEEIEKKITHKTKAIVPVHLFGQCAEMEKILEIARNHNLFVIEDAAQAIGSKYSFSDGRVLQAGTIGDIGITSFFPSKNLGCFGDGGALFTQNEQLAERIRIIANHGQKQKYYHERIGINSRLDTIQAAVLKVKLEKLNEYTESRRRAAAFYDRKLSEIAKLQIPARIPSSTHVFHQYTLKVESKKRDAFKEYLKEKAIPSMIYYPLPVHLQNAFQYLSVDKKSLSVAEALCKCVISLPMHTELDEEQLTYITETILEYFN